MNFTRFSDENFDLKDWINGAFKTQKDTNQNIEQFVATQITKLQVFIQEINNKVDDTSQQTIQNFPRILREIEILKQETFMLKEQMKNVKEDLIKVEKNTVNESMKQLLDLDIIRTNMLGVQTALQEADNWSTMSSDLDAVLLTKDLTKISNHIELMQNSLSLLKDSSDYVERSTLLEDFKNKFETLMSPEIITAFNTKSIDASKNFVQIFTKMNRLSELQKYYYQCEKAKILEKYAILSSSLSDNSSQNEVTFTLTQESGPNDLNGLLKSWLDYSLEIWQNETQWCRHIFNDAIGIVISLVTKCFEEFNKNFIKLLDAYLSDSSNQANSLDCLSQLKKEVDTFVSTIHSSSESTSALKQSQLEDSLGRLYEQIYLPFKIHLKQYGQLELKYLQIKFETTVKMNDNDTVECIELLNSSVIKVFNLIEQEIERCNQLTNSTGFAMLIDAFKRFLKNYVEDFKRIVINIRERKRLEQQQQQQQQNQQTSARTGMIIADHTNRNEGTEDWNTFRHFVRIIQIVGDLIIKYENLEETLERQIQMSFVHNKKYHRADSITTSSSDASLQVQQTPSSDEYDLLSVFSYKNYLLDETERLKLNSFISVIESGDDYSIMKDLLKPLYVLSENVHKFAFDVVFAPIKHLLGTITKGNLWKKIDPSDKKSMNDDQVPLFAMAPHEFITKIGQYILTLPQNFEPFTMQDNRNLKVALMKGKLPHLDEKDLSDEITACWLDSIANATVIAICDEILRIAPPITINSQRQLIIDIEYMSSVFDDVGLKDYYNLNHILELLKVEKDEFENLAKNKPVRVVSAIRKMRNF